MRYALIILVLPMFFLSVLAGRSDAGVDVGLSMEDGQIKGFYLAVKDYYRVPEKEVKAVRARRIPDEELSVVFFLAKKASADPSEIIELRAHGKSWMDITLHYGLDPDIFYVPVKREVSGPPYGHAYGHFKNKHKRGGPPWKRGESRDERGSGLGDGDVVNLVNLKFISEHYNLPPEEVMDMRSQGKNFISINAEIKSGKTEIGIKSDNKETGKRPDEEGDGHEGNGRRRGRWK